MIGCKKCNYLSLRKPRISGMSFNILVTSHAYMWTLLGEWQQHNKSRRACGIIQTPLLLPMGLFDQRGSAQLHWGSCLTFTSISAGEWRLSEAAQVLEGRLRVLMSPEWVQGTQNKYHFVYCLAEAFQSPHAIGHLWNPGMGHHFGQMPGWEWDSGNWGEVSGIRRVGSQELSSQFVHDSYACDTGHSRSFRCWSAVQYGIKNEILAAYGRDLGCEEVGRPVSGRFLVCKLLQWETATLSLVCLGVQGLWVL